MNETKFKKREVQLVVYNLTLGRLKQVDHCFQSSHLGFTGKPSVKTKKTGGMKACWRINLAVKGTCSCREPVLSFQHATICNL